MGCYMSDMSLFYFSRDWDLQEWCADKASRVGWRRFSFSFCLILEGTFGPQCSTGQLFMGATLLHRELTGLFPILREVGTEGMTVNVACADGDEVHVRSIDGTNICCKMREIFLAEGSAAWVLVAGGETMVPVDLDSAGL